MIKYKAIFKMFPCGGEVLALKDMQNGRRLSLVAVSPSGTIGWERPPHIQPHEINYERMRMKMPYKQYISMMTNKRKKPGMGTL